MTGPQAAVLRRMPVTEGLSINAYNAAASGIRLRGGDYRAGMACVAKRWAAQCGGYFIRTPAGSAIIRDADMTLHFGVALATAHRRAGCDRATAAAAVDLGMTLTDFKAAGGIPFDVRTLRMAGVK